MGLTCRQRKALLSLVASLFGTATLMGENKGIAVSLPAKPPLPLQTLLDFERDGHVVTRGLLSQSEVINASESLHKFAKDEEQKSKIYAEKIMEDLDTIPPPFLQNFNPHRKVESARSLAMSEALAGTAAALLGVSCVRLYQDALFWKRHGDDATAWHADLWTAPIATNSFITVWMPLQPVDADCSPLVFRTATHRDLASRDHQDDLELLGIDVNNIPDPGQYGDQHTPLMLGDATWHHGWTIHGAPPLGEGAPKEGRLAYAASYFAEGAIALQYPVEDEDAPSFQDWIDDVTPGTQLEHPLLPTVFDGEKRK